MEDTRDANERASHPVRSRERMEYSFAYDLEAGARESVQLGGCSRVLLAEAE